MGIGEGAHRVSVVGVAEGVDHWRRLHAKLCLLFVCMKIKLSTAMTYQDLLCAGLGHRVIQMESL